MRTYLPHVHLQTVLEEKTAFTRFGHFFLKGRWEGEPFLSVKTPHKVYVIVNLNFIEKEQGGRYGGYVSQNLKSSLEIFWKRLAPERDSYDILYILEDILYKDVEIINMMLHYKHIEGEGSFTIPLYGFNLRDIMNLLEGMCMPSLIDGERIAKSISMGVFYGGSLS